jgi:hypothetical protein
MNFLVIRKKSKSQKRRNVAYSRKKISKRSGRLSFSRYGRFSAPSRIFVFVTSFALVGTALLFLTLASSGYQEFPLVDTNMVDSSHVLIQEGNGHILEKGTMSGYERVLVLRGHSK